jgi:hypothetical protein
MDPMDVRGRLQNVNVLWALTDHRAVFGPSSAEEIRGTSKGKPREKIAEIKILIR